MIAFFVSTGQEMLLCTAMIVVADKNAQKAAYSTYDVQFFYLIKKRKSAATSALSAFDGNGQPISYNEHAQINPLVLV